MKTVTLSELNSAARSGNFAKLAKSSATEKHTMMKITGFDALPTKQYVVERLEISPGNLVLMCATGCSGKTMLAQYLATCISANKPLFGRFPVKQGGVIHIDQEQSEIQTLRRYIRLANGLGVPAIDVMRVTLKHRFDDPQLQLKDVEQELIDLCTDKAMCIIDSLKAVSCADENSADIEVILKMFKRVAETTQCAILCVHHKGKGKDAKQSGRGHSSIYDSCDVQFDLECSNDVYEISCAKNREGKYFDGIKYQLLDEGAYHKGQHCTEQLVFDLLQSDVKSQRQDQRAKILTSLSANGTLKHNDLFDLVKGDRSKFKDALDSLIQAGNVVEAQGPRNSILYSLSEDARNALVYA